MRKILFVPLLFIFTTIYCQKVIKGVVLDAERGRPVQGASVFLSNTSIGTSTNDEGQFQLSVPFGKFDLIISSIGYETYAASIVAAEQVDFLTIKLKVKSEQMETVIIAPFEQNGWLKWGAFFIDNFIGTSTFARNCEIKNTEVIRFRRSNANQTLSAYASEPLIIENKSLGYKIRYQLESFEYHFDTRQISYTGYPFFEKMKGGEGKENKWQKNRKEAYYGSMMHFMRALYRNRLLQEGFEVRSLKKPRNEEKLRVKSLLDSLRSNRTPGGIVVISRRETDSSDYYGAVLRQRDFYEEIGKEILPGDSIAFGINPTTAGLAFRDYLLVIYKNKPAPPEYFQQGLNRSKAMVSEIFLAGEVTIEIQANGSYYFPTDLLATGYWGWSEKISRLLPYDYQPPKD